jgi:uncharacterized delta-60 repeat protein
MFSTIKPGIGERPLRASGRTLGFAIALAALLAFSSVLAAAQAAGSLDPSFGTGGIASTTLAEGAVPLGGFQQPSGDIVVIAVVEAPDTADQDIGLVRFTPSGKLDSSFGTNGSTLTELPGGLSVTAGAFAVQPNGDILVGGTALIYSEDNAPNIYALVRYTPNGLLDPTFGNGGIVTTNFGTQQNALSALLIQPNGQIVAAGFETSVSRGVSGQTALVRYNSNGSLDTTFGTSGIVQERSTLITPTALALLSNGDYLAIGPAILGAINEVEFTSAGALVSPVTAGAITATGTGGSPSILFEPDGEYLAAGEALPPPGTAPPGFGFPRGSFDAQVQLFTETGTADSSFTSTPFTYVPITSKNLATQNVSEATALAFQANGQIVVGGSLSGTGILATTVFALERLNSNGMIDTSFGSGGGVTTAISGSAEASVNSLLVEPNGDIVAIGGVLMKSTQAQDIVLARYLAN